MASGRTWDIWDAAEEVEADAVVAVLIDVVLQHVQPLNLPHNLLQARVSTRA